MPLEITTPPFKMKILTYGNEIHIFASRILDLPLRYIHHFIRQFGKNWFLFFAPFSNNKYS